MVEQAAEVLAGTPVATSEGGGDRVVLLAKAGSLTVEADVWVEALNGAIEQFVVPKVFNTDQGIQFTGESLLHVFELHHSRLSMDGKARWRDNVFVKRLWKSVIYEEVYLKAYGTAPRPAARLPSISISTIMSAAIGPPPGAHPGRSTWSEHSPRQPEAP